MHAEIIAIGSELTSGAKLDTNSQWLSLQLAERGIPVKYHATMADDVEAMTEVLRTAVDRSDIVLVTGGLGPTLDDLTRHAMARLAGVELVCDEPSLAFIRELFSRRGRAMPERNEIQAMFPAGSEPIRNPRGSAPGIWMELDRPDQQSTCRIAVMPGVPSEMKRMYLEEVRPRLPDADHVICLARINCFGVGESDAEQMLGDLTARGREPEIGITVHDATITLRIIAEGPSERDCRRQIDEAREAIVDRLGNLVFGEEDERLQDVVVADLLTRGETLATVEIGTGGLLAAALTDVAGALECYRGGLVLPGPAAIAGELGLSADRFDPADANTPAVAEAMAEACRERFGSRLALAVTECPEFDADDSSADPQSTCAAVATPAGTASRQLVLLGDPAIRRTRTVKTALDLLRRRDEGLAAPEHGA